MGIQKKSTWINENYFNHHGIVQLYQATQWSLCICVWICIGIIGSRRDWMCFICYWSNTSITNSFIKVHYEGKIFRIRMTNVQNWFISNTKVVVLTEIMNYFLFVIKQLILCSLKQTECKLWICLKVGYIISWAFCFYYFLYLKIIMPP